VPPKTQVCQTYFLSVQHCLQVADLSQPTALRQINFTEKHKEPERDSSHEGANSPLACRGPELGIPTVDQNQEHSQQAESQQEPLLSP